VLPVAIVLLAAGSSSRLGQPKQLLAYSGSTLLRHAAEIALASRLGPVIVVLGAVEEKCRATLSGLPTIIVTNPGWEEGMGSSIATGMQEVDETLHRAVLIMLCDQPAITPDALRSLEEHQRTTGKSIVASQYDKTFGSPALFTAEHFPQLRLLHGFHGAKSLFRNQPDLGALPCPQAALDIDTEGDLALLERKAAKENKPLIGQGRREAARKKRTS
jgi:molybdenum cofactor cytidylyltransferase